MAETVFAGKQVEEFSFVNAPAGLAFSDAKVAKLSNHLFMRDGPRNRGDGERKDEQTQHLHR